MDLTEKVLRMGYDVIIGKNEDDTLRGHYQQFFTTGLQVYDYEEKNLEFIKFFPNIVDYLGEKKVVQIRQSGRNYFGAAGERKTDGPYCQVDYIQLVASEKGVDYYDVLSSIDMQLASMKNNQSSSANEVEASPAIQHK